MAKVGYAILAVILVSGLFSFWQEFRVERTLAALRELLPQQVEVLRDGKAVRLLADRLVPGDIVLLEQGNNIRRIAAWSRPSAFASTTRPSPGNRFPNCARRNPPPARN